VAVATFFAVDAVLDRSEGGRSVLVELKVVEQRYRAVIDVLDGMSVTEVAARNGVTRQTLHSWLRRYASGGMAALADKSSKPETCPHQMAPVVEARVVELRRMHPGWGPRSIRTRLANEGFSPVPGRSSIYRTLVRHHLLEPTKRKRARSDYKRWERSRSMELWQMDIVGRFHLLDGTEVKVVTGIDDHSRYCVCARIVARATAKPVCAALQWALSAHGVPHQILTDNGKVFTARFGPGPGPVLFDRICAHNDIRHILTAPYSPTTTGKVERLHRTMRKEFLLEHDRKHGTIEEFQAALDAWVEKYNSERPHQSLGDRPPQERFALAAARTPAPESEEPFVHEEMTTPASRPAGVSRWVDQRGSISLGQFRYRVGATFAGEPVEVVVRAGLVEILHGGVLIATHAERRRDEKTPRPQRTARQGRSRPPTSGMSVTRVVDTGGSVSFAGTAYRAGRSWGDRQVEVAIVAGSVQISANGKVIRVHAIRHDRSKEHGAFASPKGRPRKPKVA
jgi:transposase InsO family protein